MADTSDTQKTGAELVPAGAANQYKDREWPRPWMGDFLEALCRTPFVTAAADIARINRQHVYDVRNQYPEFAQAWDEAQAQAVELLERTVHVWGSTGLKKVETRRKVVRDADGKLVSEEVTTVEGVDVNPTLAMFVLKRFKPEYRDSYRFEHTGQGGGPIQVEHERRVAEAAAEFTADLVKLAEVRAARDEETA